MLGGCGCSLPGTQVSSDRSSSFSGAFLGVAEASREVDLFTRPGQGVLLLFHLLHTRDHLPWGNLPSSSDLPVTYTTSFALKTRSDLPVYLRPWDEINPAIDDPAFQRARESPGEDRYRTSPLRPRMVFHFC